MYEQVFNFSSRPFTTTPFVKHYFPGTSIEQALGQAKLCIDRASGPVILIGDIGTGKSLFLAMLEEQYKTEFNVVNLACARLETRKDLLQSILFTLDRPVVGLTESELRFDLMSQVKPNPKCPNGLILLVDDAESLSFELIDELRLITNYVVDGQPRVRLAMAGRFALEENLADPKVASFGQRIACRCYLQALSKDETAQYVKAHVSRAGGDAEQLFSDDALDKIFETTEGIPRLINQVGDFSLIIAGTRGTQPVSENIVVEAWADVQNIPGIVPEAVQDSTIPANDWTVIEFGQLEDAEEGTIYEFGSKPEEADTTTSTQVDEEFTDEPVESVGTTYIIPDESTSEASTNPSEASQFQPASPIWTPAESNDQTETEERVFSPFDSENELAPTAPELPDSNQSNSIATQDGSDALNDQENESVIESPPQVDSETGVDLAALQRLQEQAQANESENELVDQDEPTQSDVSDSAEPSAESTIEEITTAAKEQADLASQFSSVFGKLPDFDAQPESESESLQESATNSAVDSNPAAAAEPVTAESTLPPLDLTSFVTPPANLHNSMLPPTSPVEGADVSHGIQPVHEDTWPVSEQPQAEVAPVSEQEDEKPAALETDLPPYFVSDETPSESSAHVQDLQSPIEPESQEVLLEDESGPKMTMGTTHSFSEAFGLDANTFSATMEAAKAFDQSQSDEPIQNLVSGQPETEDSTTENLLPESGIEDDQPARNAVLEQPESHVEKTFESESESADESDSPLVVQETLSPPESIGQWTPEHAFEPVADSQAESTDEVETTAETADSFESDADSISQDVQSAEVNFEAVQNFLTEQAESEPSEPAQWLDVQEEEPVEIPLAETPEIIQDQSESIDATSEPTETSSSMETASEVAETDTIAEGSPSNPFAETFAQEELLRDRFAPVIAAQNQISSQLTSSDLVCVQPLDTPDSTPETSAQAHEESSLEQECLPTEPAEVEAQSLHEDSQQISSVEFQQTDVPPIAESSNAMDVEPAALPENVRYAVVRPSAQTELPQQPDKAATSSYHQQVTNVVDEDISRQADEILKRLQVNQQSPPVSHETEVNTNLDQNPAVFEVDESEAILNEIRSQHDLIQAHTNTNLEDSNSQITTHHQDDKEMIVMNPQTQDAPQSKPEPAKIPLPETPASTGRAERMDYQQLFDQLRNVNQQNSGPG